MHSSFYSDACTNLNLKALSMIQQCCASPTCLTARLYADTMYPKLADYTNNLKILSTWGVLGGNAVSLTITWRLGECTTQYFDVWSRWQIFALDVWFKLYWMILKYVSSILNKQRACLTIAKPTHWLVCVLERLIVLMIKVCSHAHA